MNMHHPGRWRSRTAALAAIAAVAVAGGLLADAGREAQAQDAQATYMRTASPAGAVMGG